MQGNAKQAKIDYERLSRQIGEELALYCVCAVYDIRYTSESACESFDDYLKDAKNKAFSDGDTNVQSAILSGMDESDRWTTVWGDGYSESDYRQLDELYQTMTAQLDSTGGIDRQQDDTARTCAMMALRRNKLIRVADKDSIAMAKQLDTMIRDNLKDSNMRKADILPSAQQKLPTIVDVVRKKLNMNPDDFTQDDVWEAFHAWCKKKKYPFTMDAVEHMTMLILNTIQRNDDMPEMYHAPEDMDFSAFETEFEGEPNEAENEAYEYGGFVRGEWEKQYQ